MHKKNAIQFVTTWLPPPHPTPWIFCVNHKVCGVVPFLNKCLHHNCWFSSNNKVVSKISWWVTNEATHEKRLPWIFAFGHCRCGVCIVFSSSLPTFAVKEPSSRRGENKETETPSGKNENSKTALKTVRVRVSHLNKVLHIETLKFDHF